MNKVPKFFLLIFLYLLGMGVALSEGGDVSATQIPMQVNRAEVLESAQAQADKHAAEARAAKKRAMAEAEAAKKRAFAEADAAMKRTLAEVEAAKKRAIAENEAGKKRAQAEAVRVKIEHDAQVVEAKVAELKAQAAKKRALAEEEAAKKRLMAETVAAKKRSLVEAEAAKKRGAVEAAAERKRVMAEAERAKVEHAALAAVPEEEKATQAAEIMVAKLKAKAAKKRAMAEVEAANKRALAEAEAAKKRAIAEAGAANNRALAETEVAKKRAMAESERLKAENIAKALAEERASEQVKAADTKVADTKVADTKVADTKVADTKVADTKVADTKVADTKVADTKAVDTKAVDTKAADTKAADTKAADTKAADTKAADTKAADTKAADTKAADTKAVDTKAVDTKVADTKAVDAKAADAKAPKAKVAQSDMLVDFAQKAVLKNPDVLTRWHNFQAAVSEKSAAQGGFFPRLDVTADSGRERGGSLFTNAYDTNTRNLSVTLTQMLYDGFATRNEVRRLNNAQLARYYDLLDASETAALEAVRAFYDVSRQRKLFELTEDNYIRHRTAFEQIKLKVEAGVGRRVDLEQAAGRLALSESNLTLDNANVHDVSARFQRIIGELPPLKMRNSPSQSKLAKQILPNAADAVLSVALDYHPAILSAVENVRSAHYDQYGRWAKFQPTVNLSISKTESTNSGGVQGTTGTTAAKVVLNWNLFSGGSDLARSTQYARRYDSARDLRDKACRDVRMTLAIAYNDISKLKEQLNFLDQHQLSIEKARGAYQKQFEIGQRSLLDLLDTENELYQARRSYTNAEYDLAIAQARTIAGMGKLVSALGIAHLETADLPDLLGTSADGPENCPPEPPLANDIDKEKLDARAIEEAKAAFEAARVKEAELKAKQDAEDKAFLMTPAEAETAKLKAGENAKAMKLEPISPTPEQKSEAATEDNAMKNKTKDAAKVDAPRVKVE